MDTTLFRFDYMIKYLYVYGYENNLQTDFFRNIYILHMHCINNFDEITRYKNCKIIKNNGDICVKIFNKIIDSLKKNGFDENYPIPLGMNNIITNGMHRYAICNFYKISPVYNNEKLNGSLNYNYNFFLNRDKHQPLSNAGLPLSQEICDFTALEYIKHNSNIRTMILYPKGCAIDYNNDTFENILKSYGHIYYKKNVFLTKIGFKNLIKECYRNEKWIGGLFPTDALANNKTNLCYDNNGKIIIYLIHINELSKLIDMKEKCRKIFDINKCSLHTSDYQEDTFRISSCLLNRNSLHFLNNAETDKISNNFKNYFTNLSNKIKYNEDFCITSSAILDVYGLRESQDLDYLHKTDLNVNINNISPHKDKWLSYYHKHKHDIIYNPENHFYFNGFKFCTLDVIKKMKENRGEEKDIRDVILINNI